MNHYFEEVKQHHPQLAKALGITEGMGYEEWRESHRRAILASFTHSLPIDIDKLKEQVPFPENWYSYLTPQLQPTNTKE